MKHRSRDLVKILNLLIGVKELYAVVICQTHNHMNEMMRSVIDALYEMGCSSDDFYVNRSTNTLALLLTGVRVKFVSASSTNVHATMGCVFDEMIDVTFLPDTTSTKTFKQSILPRIRKNGF